MKSKIILFFILLLSFSLSAGSIQGVISDASSNVPVQSALVSVLGFTPNTSDSIYFQTYTDSTGSYLFENLGNGHYFLRCIHPQYFPASGSVQLSDSLNNVIINIQLVPHNSTFSNSVSGQVLSEPTLLPVQKPIPDAVITLKGNGVLINTSSDSGGFYLFENIMPGLYFLSAFAENHYPAFNFDTVFVETNSQISNLNIYLTPMDSTSGMSLTGYVLSADSMNGPVHPAVIDLISHNSNGDSLFYRSLNNADGSYDFNNLFPGIYSASVKSAGYETLFIDSLEIQGNSTYDFYLTPIIQPPVNFITGHIFNQVNDSPLQNAKIKMISVNGNQNYQTTSDPGGKYGIFSVIPDTYLISAKAYGFIPSSPDTIVINQNTQISNYDIYLIPENSAQTTTLHGTVYADSSNLATVIHPAEIVVLGFSTVGDSLLYTTQNNPDGSYVIDNIRTGRYTVLCKAQDYRPRFMHNVLISGDSLKIDFYLAPKPSVLKGLIEGEVVFDQSNDPVQWAFIEFINKNIIHNFHAFTDQNGHYQAQLPPGQYIVSCRYMNADSFFIYQEFYDDVHSIQDATPVDITANDTSTGIDFGIPQFGGVSHVVVEGMVLDSDNNPLDSALVSIWPKKPRHTIPDSTRFFTFSDEMGYFSLDIQFNASRPFFAFIISARKEGYKIEFYQEKPVHFLADILFAWNDTTFTAIDFTLDAFTSLNSIEGRVTDVSGTPLPHVFVIGSNASNGQLVFSFTDQQGRYSLADLENESYYLLFNKAGFIPEFYDDAPIWEDATPVLANGQITGIDADLVKFFPDSGEGLLTGTVKDMMDAGLPGVLITIRDLNGNIRDYTFSGPDGSYTLDGIQDGEYELCAGKISYQSELKSIYFSNTLGSVMMIDFTLDETVLKVSQGVENEQIPGNLELFGNFPNPFNPRTKISFGLPEGQYVKLTVYNLLGQQVKVLVNQYLSAGSYEAEWDGLDNTGKPVSSGIYFYSLETINEKIVRKMIFSK